MCVEKWTSRDGTSLNLDFVKYCQVYEKSRNDMNPRSMGGISLITKNDRGSYYFMLLETGIIIHARQWTVLHATESVIGRVNQLAADEGINKIVDEDILFQWNPGDPIILQPNYEEVISPLNHTINEEPKGNVGRDVIVFGEEERDIT